LKTGVDWQAVRAEFPSLRNWTYLNTATYGQMPARAVRAVEGHFARRDETACSDFLTWFDDADRLRTVIAKLIHAEPGDIAFAPNASLALSWLTSGLEWQPGDRVLTLRDEFPNNLYAAAALAPQGVEMVEAPWEEFHGALGPRTRLVLLSEVNYMSGFRPPLAEISRCAHEAGALLCVDGTQSLGALRFDVASVQPDMYAVDGYKWLMSPNGAGFAYVAPSVREKLRPGVIGWRSDRRWRQVASLHHGEPEFAPLAEKFEGGILPFPSLYGMEASAELVLEIGPEAIERRVLELAALVRSALRGLGAEMAEGPLYEAPVIAARFSGRDPSALARELKTRRVLVSARHGNLRVSTHLYNNEEDIERLVSALRALL